jgi:hypothetical protein
VFEAVSAGRSHFRVEDLLKLVALIAQDKQVNRPQRLVRCEGKASRK